MAKVIDIKPNNRIVEDVKPNNKLIINSKPNNKLVYSETTIYRDDRTVEKGEIMLLVPLITFAEAGTYSNAVRI